MRTQLALHLVEDGLDRFGGQVLRHSDRPHVVFADLVDRANQQLDVRVRCALVRAPVHPQVRETQGLVTLRELGDHSTKRFGRQRVANVVQVQMLAQH